MVRWSMAMALCSALLAVNAMATPTPDYRVLAALGERIEVREYAPLIVAETTVSPDGFKDAGNSGFKVLADYIFGNNQGARKIAMTAPVEQRRGDKIAMTAPVAQSERGDGTWVVAFTMPKEWSMATLPLPNNPQVTLREVPQRVVAAIRFSGTWSDKRFTEHRAELLASLQAGHYQVLGEPWSARYDPPWTPWFMRRNEVLVELVSASPSN